MLKFLSPAISWPHLSTTTTTLAAAAENQKRTHIKWTLIAQTMWLATFPNSFVILVRIVRINCHLEYITLYVAWPLNNTSITLLRLTFQFTQNLEFSVFILKTQRHECMCVCVWIKRRVGILWMSVCMCFDFGCVNVRRSAGMCMWEKHAQHILT